MKGLPEDRAAKFARYIIETGATVRETAKECCISKSTVHTEVILSLIHIFVPAGQHVEWQGGSDYWFCCRKRFQQLALL